MMGLLIIIVAYLYFLFQTMHCQLLQLQIFIKKMSRTPQKSPQTLKKNHTASASSLHKSKIQLPSRYILGNKNEKSGLHQILNSIQAKARIQTVENSSTLEQKPKTLFNAQLLDLKINKKHSQFKSHPLKRQQSDKLQFNEIFLNPRQEALSTIQKSLSQQNPKTMIKQYEKLLKFQKGETITEQSQKLEINNVKQSYQQAIQLLQIQEFFNTTKKNDQDFYDSQISIEPPSLTNRATIISGPKVSQAPSLPPNYNNYKDLNIKQLLLRAKAGMNSEDMQKEAHLSFLLGEVYLQRRKYKGALKFFKRFLGFAKIMEDRIGMSLGANRVGISHYYCKDFQKSIVSHNQNLKLSGSDHCFFGFYNIGICYRKLNRPQTALQYFQSALNWAQQKGEEESQCLSFGQIGSTYQGMQLYQESVEKFQQSLDICNKIKKKNLKLINLRNILRISSRFKMKSIEQLQKIAIQSFQCAKQLGDFSILDIFRSNIGILKGIEQLQSQLLSSQEVEQIQQII